MLNRRRFLGMMGASVAAALIIPAQTVEGVTMTPVGTPVVDTVGYALARGDIFTIEGVYAINPATYAAIPRLQQFVVTADVSADEALVPIAAIYPRIVTSGPYKNAACKTNWTNGVPKGQIDPLGLAPHSAKVSRA